jgi:hypothetical protein
VTGAAAVAALQAALAAENAAIYGCGVAGAHLSGEQLDAITRAWNAHRARRDQLEAMVRSRGAEPAAALPSYRLPQPVSGPRDAVSVAMLIEDRVTAAYLRLVALPDAGLRTFGALAMQEAAVRAAIWRGRTIAFPGLPASAITSPRARNAITAATGIVAARPLAGAATSSARPAEHNAANEGGPEPGGHSGFVPGKKQGPTPKQRGKGPHGKR